MSHDAPASHPILAEPIASRGSRAGLAGHLALTCSADEAGRSFLSRQSFRAPFHLGKPYLDGGTLGVQLVNPTAGLFAGDTLTSAISVNSGASLHVTSASATRVFTTVGEERAEVRQHLTVARGGRLAFVPAMLVPHRESRYHQTTRIELASGGQLLYMEALAPGRVAHGESFRYTELSFELDLYIEDHLNVRERFHLRPSDSSCAALRKVFPDAYYLSCFVVNEHLTAQHQGWQDLQALHGPEIWVGISRLPISGWRIHVLALDGIHLRRASAAILEGLWDGETNRRLRGVQTSLC